MRKTEDSQPKDSNAGPPDVREPASSGLSGRRHHARSASPAAPSRGGTAAVSSFLQGGGVVGARMRSHDWSKTSLGEPSRWPRALQNTVGLVLDSQFPMFLAWGPELTFLYNDAYSRILEDKHPSALGRPFCQVWEDLWPQVEPIVRRALEGQSEYYADVPFTLRRKGLPEQAWFTFSYSPLRDDAGEVAGVYCACTETTGLVLSQRHQRAEYLRLRDLFQQAPGLIAIVREPNHVFDFANDAYLRLVGQRELIGKSVLDALPEVAGQGFVELLDNVYRSGEPYIGTGVAVSLQRATASPMEERFVDFIYQPIRNEHGQTTGIFVEGSDVTERVLANKALLEGERRKDEFLAMLAHELRNPLAPIRTAAEILKRPGVSADIVRRASDILSRQAAHMTELVNDLLDVSRVNRGLVTLRDEPVDLPSVLDEAVEQTQSWFGQRDLHFSADLAPGPLFVSGDRTRLVQVFSNILQNAAKYTPAGGHVSLTLRAERAQLRVAVADDGVGIHPDLLPHLFELFTQGQRTPDRSQGGLGLGLSLVKSLVALHQGTVCARSEGVGKGSEFVVLLPRAEVAEDDRERRNVDAQGGAPGSALNLLVVDDNVDAAETLRLLLEMMGHAVSVAHTGTAALELARKCAPQVLFLDIGLPDMEGYELVRRMRLLPETAASTMVALTGYGQREDREKALRAGFDRHLVKPLSIDELTKVVSVPHIRPRAGAQALGRGQPDVSLRDEAENCAVPAYVRPRKVRLGD
ncbi:ATP-binding protein [Ramlibacter sp.]|uniref:PAS domain-containing hybrid sensor histidine kinase/response regulator n=1 Tax=Ramlibacter sp. TaxID=1917967 RepID=UPI0026037F93|nr:ATP-binding protein [Ramlibacter sp.]MDB5955489.1 hybrid sensor histidine kinase/response regulator [Ramlibacter sp.]